MNMCMQCYIPCKPFLKKLQITVVWSRSYNPLRLRNNLCVVPPHLADFGGVHELCRRSLLSRSRSGLKRPIQLSSKVLLSF